MNKSKSEIGVNVLTGGQTPVTFCVVLLSRFFGELD